MEARSTAARQAAGGDFMGVGYSILVRVRLRACARRNFLTYNCVCTRLHHPSRGEGANLEGKSKDWRLMIASPMFFLLIPRALIYFSPESPR